MGMTTIAFASGGERHGRKLTKARGKTLDYYIAGFTHKLANKTIGFQN
jgi:hypothetical protein